MAIQYLNSIDLNQNELHHAVIENQPNDTAAGNGVDGQIYFNTTSDTLMIWKNDGWEEVSGGSSSATSSDNSYVNISGDTMTGDLTVSKNNPVISLDDNTASDHHSNKIDFQDGRAKIHHFDDPAGNRLMFYVENIYPSGNTVFNLRSNGQVDLYNTSESLNASLVIDGTLRANGSGDSLITNGNLGIGTTNAISKLHVTGDVSVVDGEINLYTTRDSDGSFDIRSGFIGSDTSNLKIGTENNLLFYAGVGTDENGDDYPLERMRITDDGRLGINTSVIGLGQRLKVAGTQRNLVFSTTGNLGVGIDVPSAVIHSGGTIKAEGSIEIKGTGRSSFAGQVKIPQTPVENTDAASKHYVDQSVVGALTYKGGYNAAANSSTTTVIPENVKKGDTYTVYNYGNFFTEKIQAGDVIIAEKDSAAILADWTVVQKNIDVATGSTPGICYVDAGRGLGLLVAGGGRFTVYSKVKREALANEKDYVTRTEAGGVTTFTIDVTGYFGEGSEAIDVMVEVVGRDTNAGDTVYAKIGRSESNLTIKFAGSVNNYEYQVLLNYIGD